MNEAVKLLKLLPTNVQAAVTVAEIAQKWYGEGPTKEQKRNIQRYVNDLSYGIEFGEGLINEIEGSPRKFYLRLSQVASWFMTEEAALSILLTRQSLGNSLLGVVGNSGANLNEIAESVAGASVQTKRIRERIRVVPDGLGRMPAFIPPEVLQTVIAAIAQERQVEFDYRTSSGVDSTELVSPQGIVAKDGSLYLIATKGLSDTPRYFGLQRMANVSVSHRHHQDQEGFNFDSYITNSNLSSRLRAEPENIDLELIIRKDAIYHFRERPLANNQTIGEPESDGRYSVAAHIPWTVALLPFLLSLGAGVQVIAPARLRLQVQTALEESAALYRG